MKYNNDNVRRQDRLLEESTAVELLRYPINAQPPTKALLSVALLISTCLPQSVSFFRLVFAWSTANTRKKE